MLEGTYGHSVGQTKMRRESLVVRIVDVAYPVSPRALALELDPPRNPSARGFGMVGLKAPILPVVQAPLILGVETPRGRILVRVNIRSHTGGIHFAQQEAGITRSGRRITRQSTAARRRKQAVFARTAPATKYSH